MPATGFMRKTPTVIEYVLGRKIEKVNYLLENTDKCAIVSREKHKQMQRFI